MQLLSNLEHQLSQLDERQLRRKRRVTTTPCAKHMQVDGREMLAFCSNDYLGLASHPQVVAAMRDGVGRYGAGSGGSALIGGYSRAHMVLENALASFMAPHFEAPRALYFSNGYMANLAILTTLAGKESEIFSESLSHASIIDGARLSRANVKIYPHCDVTALEKMLAESTAPTKLVVTDSVFSMDGNIAPLSQLLEVCTRHQAWLVVDDAHGFGVLGAHGRGALEHFGLRSPYLVYMATLGKAAGVAGAFVAAHGTVIELLLQRARTYIFTTAEVPAVAHALLSSLEIIAGDEGAERRAILRRHIATLRGGIDLRHWALLASDTAIQPLIIGSNDDAMKISAALYAEGFWIPAIRPPTVPKGTARLRIALSAGHTESDIERLVSILNRLEQGVR